MKNLLLILLTAALTAFVWAWQHSRVSSVVRENETLAARLQELEARAQQADSVRQAAERRSDELHARITAREASLAPAATVTNPVLREAVAQPDPARQGGWPAGAAYLYLPKQYLTNAQYKLLDGGRLTDEAATLLGMSAVERSTVDQFFSELSNRFRQLELGSMKRIELPQGWEGGLMGAKLESAVIYQVPDLATDVEAARQQFSQWLQQSLGASRGQLLDQAASAFFRQHLDDLGAGDRTIGFLTATERDGSQALWYATADARHGDGSFQRVMPNVAPDSQIAYYASLFGVPLPKP
jgi:hypothetical protein